MNPESPNWKASGWKLKVYFWEKQTYPDFQTVNFDRVQAVKYLKKFSRHFKTSCPVLSRIIKRGGGHYTPSFIQPRIALGKNPSLGIVCHEFAHHLDTLRHPDTKQWHGKSFKRELKRVYTFAKRYLPKKEATPPEVA